MTIMVNPGKKRFADFAVPDYSIAVESKVCDSAADVNHILDENNADIIVYKKRYENLIHNKREKIYRRYRIEYSFRKNSNSKAGSTNLPSQKS